MAATWRLTVPGMQVHGNVRRRGHVCREQGGVGPGGQKCAVSGHRSLGALARASSEGTQPGSIRPPEVREDPLRGS